VIVIPQANKLTQLKPTPHQSIFHIWSCGIYVKVNGPARRL